MPEEFERGTASGSSDALERAMREFKEHGRLGVEKTQAPRVAASLISWVVVVLVLLGAVLGAGLYLIDRLQPAASFTFEEEALGGALVPAPESIIAAVRAGNYADAIAIDELIAQSTVPPEQKAQSLVYAFGARYKESGRMEDYVRDIEALKILYAEGSLSRVLRAQSARMVANAYLYTGEGQAVYGTIFNEPPFNSFVVPRQPLSTIRTVHEWAFERAPSAASAALIASLYVREVLDGTASDAETKSTHLVQAREYLRKADLYARQGGIEPEVWGMDGALGYRFWRAFTTASLAYLGVDEYRAHYRTEYADLITYMTESQSADAAQYIPHAHWMYATFLYTIEGDTDAAQEELEHLMSAVAADSRGGVRSEFARYLSQRVQRDDSTSTDFFVQTIPELKKVSKPFALFIEDIYENH